MKSRDENLDLLRAMAIVMVLVFHTLQRWPTQYPSVRAFTDYGVFGVNLFFVLSGWLIGGLYWRELAQFKNVQIGRFIVRRALRTMPPYVVALLIAWLGVRMSRGEPFLWQYLFFIQNYLPEMPFFRISWSLCVEEHFYLFMPWVMLAFSARSRRASWGLAALAILPILFRAAAPAPIAGGAFGYPQAATHFNFEGLILGVWAAYLREFNLPAWASLKKVARLGWLPALVLVALVKMLPEAPKYVLANSVVAVAFLLALVRVAEEKPLVPFGSRWIYAVAVTSYSVYLIHSVVLDVAFRIVDRLPNVAMLQNALIVLIVLACLAGSGAAFYWLVEAPTLKLRSRLMPSRPRPAAISAAPAT